jgi:hypothetical protein
MMLLQPNDRNAVPAAELAMDILIARPLTRAKVDNEMANSVYLSCKFQLLAAPENDHC